VALVTAALSRGSVGAYQLQAAIAAVHDEAPSAEATDWPTDPGAVRAAVADVGQPMVALNHAIATANGARAGGGAGAARRAGARRRGWAEHHRLDAVRGHLLERAGDREAAQRHYRSAGGAHDERPEGTTCG